MRARKKMVGARYSGWIRFQPRNIPRKNNLFLPLTSKIKAVSPKKGERKQKKQQRKGNKNATLYDKRQDAHDTWGPAHALSPLGDR
jgi:hypothetical protein